MSIWTAPITAGGGTRPTITVKPSAKADVGVVALEYSGRLDGLRRDRPRPLGLQHRHDQNGRRPSPPAPPSRRPAPNDLAIGFYLDSGFGDTLAGGSGYTTRANVSPEENIELLAQDAVVTAGATPNPTFSTGAATTWLASTVVLASGRIGTRDRARRADRSRRHRRQRQRQRQLDSALQRQQPAHAPTRSRPTSARPPRRRPP